jgi:hypothetical protein
LHCGLFFWSLLQRAAVPPALELERANELSSPDCGNDFCGERSRRRGRRSALDPLRACNTEAGVPALSAERDECFDHASRSL